MTQPLPPKNHPDALFFFHHKGWDVFSLSEEYDHAKVKELYFAINDETQEEKELDISPWGFGYVQLIKRIIDANFPRRIGPSPLTHSDLDQIERFSKAAE